MKEVHRLRSCTLPAVWLAAARTGEQPGTALTDRLAQHFLQKYGRLPSLFAPEQFN